MNLIKQSTSAGWLSDTSARMMERVAGTERSIGLSAFGSGESQRLLRRRGLGLLAWVALWLAVAGLYLYRTEPQYVASAQVVLEVGRPGTMGSDTTSAPAPNLDSAQADSQVQVIRSERNLRFVFDTLDLKDDPSFAPAGPGLLARIFGRGGSEAEGADPFDVGRAVAFENFSDRVGARRIAQSYVLEVSFLAGTPAEAARIANAITAAFLRDQIRFKAVSVERGTQLLQGRIADLKMEQEAATEAVRTGIMPDMPFADADARVVSAALPPLGKAFPQSKLILAFAASFGLMTGVGGIVLRHSLDRVVRSRRQIMQALGMDLLAALPRVPRPRTKGADRGRPLLRMAVDEPFSAFAQTMRNLRTAVFHASATSHHLALGIVSCSPGEGRSTLAANLAFMLAASSEATMLVDGDLQHSDLTVALAPNAPSGLTDTLLAHGVDPEFPALPLASDLSFVPAVAAGQMRNPNVFIGSATMQTMLVRARDRVHLIVDLPPLSLSSDAQAIGRLLDGVILLVEVDRTTIDQVEEALRALRHGDARVIGVVLNKALTSSETRSAAE